MGLVITIDGPAASGKTSVSRELAKKLGWSWVSTGAFYRGLAFAALQERTDLANSMALEKLARAKHWRVEMQAERTRVFYRSQDVTDAIFDEAVGSIASQISHFPEVRNALLEPQRDCKHTTEALIAEGRDCGTVVFPDAEIKIFLTADQENRAVRRARESGQDSGEISKAQKLRDQQDSSRKVAPLQIPNNAIVVDTTTLTLDDVVNSLMSQVQSRLSAKSKPATIGAGSPLSASKKGASKKKVSAAKANASDAKSNAKKSNAKSIAKSDGKSEKSRAKSKSSLASKKKPSRSSTRGSIKVSSQVSKAKERRSSTKKSKK